MLQLKLISGEDLESLFCGRKNAVYLNQGKFLLHISFLDKDLYLPLHLKSPNIQVGTSYEVDWSKTTQNTSL